METDNNKTSRIGKDFSFLQLVGFCMPSILNQLITQIFKSLDDGLFVSRYAGKTALAGLNVLSPLTFFQFGLNNLFSLGSCNISSQEMGRGRKDEARRIFSRVVITAFIVGSLFALALNIFSGPVLRFLGADEELAQYAIISLRLVFMITPISIINNIFNNYFAPAGKPVMGLICSIVNGTLNILLDVILVVILRKGVWGACIATATGDIVSFIIGFIFFLDKRNDIYFVKPEGKYIRTTWEAWKSGFPQSFNVIAMAFTALLTNHQLLIYIGNDGIAANALVTDLRRILTAAIFGFTNCAGPIVSYNFGALDFERQRKTILQIGGYLLGSSVLISTLGMVFRDQLIGIFIAADSMENSQIFYEQARFGVTLEFTTIFFITTAVTFMRIFTCVNMQRISLRLTIVRNVILRAILLATLPLLWQDKGIWFASPACEILTALYGGLLFARYARIFGFKKKA